jgi:putative SOS response-associated peptidase YedK
MCGRYYRRSDKQRIGDAFNISDLPSSLIISEDYNVAPTTFQPVIRNDKETGELELVLMRWAWCRSLLNSSRM